LWCPLKAARKGFHTASPRGEANNKKGAKNDKAEQTNAELPNPRRAQESPKRAPRKLQESLKRVPREPKESPKRAPRELQESHKRAQETYAGPPNKASP